MSTTMGFDPTDWENSPEGKKWIAETEKAEKEKAAAEKKAKAEEAKKPEQAPEFTETDAKAKSEETKAK